MEQFVKDSILSAFDLIKNSYTSGGKLLVAGNGGSMSDSQHIVGELMKCFAQRRSIDPDLCRKLGQLGELGAYLSQNLEGALPAIALDAPSLTSAIANDSGVGDLSFAQMVYGLGRKDDVFWGISTSGNARNVCLAAVTAKAKGMKVLGLTGKGGGALKPLCDVCISVPETETYRVQELHVQVYHELCLMLERQFFGD